MNDALLPTLCKMSRRAGPTRAPEAGGSTCPNCQAALQAAAKYCAECGQSVIDRRAEPASASVPVPQRAERDGEPSRCDDVRKVDVRKTERRQAVDPRRSNVNSKVAEPGSCMCEQVRAPDATFCRHCGKSISEKSTEYWLHRVGSSTKGQPRTAVGEQLILGKACECDLTILEDNFVSRHHARLFRLNGKLLVEDLNSSNGTCLRIRRPIVIEPGDELIVGKSVFRVEGGLSESAVQEVVQ